MVATLVRMAACAGLVLGPAATAAAQSDVRRQQALAEAYLKQAGVRQPAAAEAAGLQVYGSVTEAEARALADTLQGIYQASRSALSYGADDSLWAGKMTVVVLSDPQQFAAYHERVAGRPPAPGQTAAFDTRGDMPYLVVGPPAEGRQGFDPTRAAATMMAAAVLNRRAGTPGTLPDWLTGGFAEGMIARAAGDPQTLAAYRNAVRTSVLGGTGGPGRTAVLADAWAGPRTPGNTAVSAAFVEYLMARTTPAQFDRFLAAFQQREGQPPPALDDALRVLPLSRVAMETDWKIWAAQQR